MALRSNLVPDGPPTKVDLGSRVLPFVETAAPAPAVVIKGLGTGPDTQLIYQHSKASSAQFGQLYAVRKTGNPEDIEIYWMTHGVRNVIWPYELHRYTADWPTDPGKYQRYVRGVGTALGPDVKIPANLAATLMPFQEPSGHANPVVNQSFSTTGGGWSLLKYDEGDAVSFQAVRSLIHDDPVLQGVEQPQPLEVSTWNIGQEIIESSHEGPRQGFVYVPEGNRYDWEIYDGAPGDPPGFKTQQIIPVNTGTLEVWWSNVNQGVQWPSFVKRYQAVWPSTPSKIVIASLRGGGAIDPLTKQDYRLYYQNNPALPGSTRTTNTP